MKIAAEEDEGIELPNSFPIEFRYWIRDHYYEKRIDQRLSPKYKSIRANSLFKNESENTKKKIYMSWVLIQDARDDQYVTEEEFKELNKRQVGGIKSLLVQDDKVSPNKEESDDDRQLKLF